MQAESKTCVDCNMATWLAMEKQIDRNLPSHNRIVNTLVHQHCSEAAMAAEAHRMYVVIVHNIAKVLSLDLRSLYY